jgi:hypothetical protein
MHDTFLLNNISEKLNEVCLQNKIQKVNKLEILVNENSHINSVNLFEYLKRFSSVVGEWTEIKVVTSQIEEQTAILNSIEGETAEE